MKLALRHPALQSAAGVGALVALTWPLLVFERALHVFVGLFVVWGAAIAVLFVFSRALDGARDGEAHLTPDPEDKRARGD